MRVVLASVKLWRPFAAECVQIRQPGTKLRRKRANGDHRVDRGRAAFGAFVLVGSGGVFAELFDDAGLAPAPVTREGAAALLAGLKIWPVLQGARGRAKADVTINPLILRVDGQGVVAVDARARLEA
jgi:ATP-grasp domain